MKYSNIQIEAPVNITDTDYTETEVTKHDIKALKDFCDNHISNEISKLERIKPSGKKVGVFFSGGYDSTALIIKNLEAGNEVYPLNILFTDLTEDFIGRIILYQLRQVYGNELLHDLVTVVDCRKIGKCIEDDLEIQFENLGFTLQPQSAFYAAFVPLEIMKEISEIQFGFVLKDVAISFLDEFNSIYKNTLKFKLYPNIFNVPSLVFPLKQIPHVFNIDAVLGWTLEHNLVLPCSSCDQHIKVFTMNVTENIIKYMIHDCYSCPKCKDEHNIHNTYTITITKGDYDEK